MSLSGLCLNPHRLTADDDVTAALIEKLNDDHYHSRQAAKTALIDRAVAGQASVLPAGLSHASMEVRIAVAEILAQLRQQEFSQQIERLLDPNEPEEAFSWPGWQQFSAFAGRDLRARQAFARICRRYPIAFSSLAGMMDRPSSRPSLRGTLRANPYRMNPDDLVGWVVMMTGELLAMEPSQNNQAHARQTSQIAMALSQASMGPRFMNPGLAPSLPAQVAVSIVLRRLLSQWLHQTPSIIDDRTRLQVAVRYGCTEVAIKISDEVLRNPHAPPAAIVTAMLTMAKRSVEPTQKSLSSQAFAAHISDSRTAHVWQSAASRNLPLRTQVRDVALALMLDAHGQDPREFGFTYLEADPLLRFRDFSLGFETDRDRDQAYATAAEFLNGQF